MNILIAAACVYIYGWKVGSLKKDRWKLTLPTITVIVYQALNIYLIQVLGTLCVTLILTPTYILDIIMFPTVQGGNNLNKF